MQAKTLSDLRIAWSGLQEELGRRQSQSRAYYAIAQVLCTVSFFTFSLVITCFQDIESLSHELGVIRGKEDTCELELLEVCKSHQTH